MSDSNVLILGESGTGKELVARALHNFSKRKRGPFVPVNCGALPDTLLESELFGYKAGAFTDAKHDKEGRFAAAEGGTLFLDEIGDISPALQVKLLRVLQTKTYEPLGSNRSVKADVRIVAATNRDLKALVQEGKFREDLYYRLNVVELTLPPLRERKEDIPILVQHFLEKFSRIHNKKIKGISPEAMKLLLSYDYPGNVRELENIIERAVVISSGKQIELHDLPEELFRDRAKSPQKNEELERIKEALKIAKGNKSLAAKLLGMHRTTLWRKLKEYGLS